MPRDFEYFVGGIEDAILDLLEAEMKPLGVKNFYLYSGELDSENLKQALGALSPQFPVILVSYTDGEDIQDPKTSPILKDSIFFRHQCSFAAICVSSDSRGENARRRGKLVNTTKIGVYGMLSKVRELLGGIRFIKVEDDETVILNAPLMPNGVEHIAKIPNLTAYAAIFDTYFRFETRNRNSDPIEVSEVLLELDAVEGNNPTNLPGVKVVGENND